MKTKPTSLTDLITDVTEFSIIITLYTFQSLNLKQMSALMDIPESTLLRKLKDLIKYEVLALDNQATLERRGKYYCLSKNVQIMIDSQDFEPIKLKNEGMKENPETLRKAQLAMVGISGINYQLARITSKFFDVMPEIAFQAKEEKIKIGSSHSVLNFNSRDQIIEFSQIYTDFLQKIEKFENQKEAPPHFIHTFHTFSCPVGILNSNEFLEKLGESQKKSKK